VQTLEQGSSLLDATGLGGSVAFASKLLAFGARLPRALESAVVQLPSLLEPPAAQTAAEHAAARTTHDLAQLAQLVYTPLAEQPLAGRQPFGLTIDDGSCNLWEIVLCTDALSHLDPISGRVLAVPALCIFRSPEGLALSFRGTKTVDDARVDAYGMSWLEDAPKFGGGVAAVHGGFWRSWSDTGAANLVRGVLEAEARSEAAVAAAEGLEAREPLRLLITGHSLGAAVATVAAHDLALAMINGSLPARPIELVTFGKPAVGGEAWRENFSALLGAEGTPLRRAEWYATATGWAADIITMGGVEAPDMGTALVHSASVDPATWMWVHEIEGYRLSCCVTGEPCEEEAVKERDNLFLCHSMSAYQSGTRRLVRSAAGELTACQAADPDLPKAYRHKSVCGAARHIAHGNVSFSDEDYNEWCTLHDHDRISFGEWLVWLILWVCVLLALHVVGGLLHACVVSMPPRLPPSSSRPALRAWQSREPPEARLGRGRNIHGQAGLSKTPSPLSGGWSYRGSLRRWTSGAVHADRTAEADASDSLEP